MFGSDINGNPNYSGEAAEFFSLRTQYLYFIAYYTLLPIMSPFPLTRNKVWPLTATNMGTSSLPRPWCEAARRHETNKGTIELANGAVTLP